MADPTVTYRLPDGREVQVFYSASLNRYRIPYTLADGRVVMAENVNALLLPCSCGQAVHLRAIPLRINRKRGVHHWLEHEDGTDACPGPQGRWASAKLKPYPKEEIARPGAELMIRWNDWRLLAAEAPTAQLVDLEGALKRSCGVKP